MLRNKLKFLVLKIRWVRSQTLLLLFVYPSWGTFKKKIYWMNYFQMINFKLVVRQMHTCIKKCLFVCFKLILLCFFIKLSILIDRCYFHRKKNVSDQTHKMLTKYYRINKAPPTFLIIFFFLVSVGFFDFNFYKLIVKIYQTW